MEIIERYIHEVGRRLPRKSRRDVQVELHTLLHETLEGRGRQTGRPADAELAAQILREFGAPQEVAERYAPPARYLIGPRWYPTFILIAKIIAIVLPAVLGAFLIVALVFSKGPLAPLSVGKVARMVWTFLSAGIFNLAILTLVFAIVERTQLQPDKEEVEAWDPSSLPAVDDPDRISPVGHVFSMYGILALAALFNFLPEWVGIYWPREGSWQVTPLLLPDFARYMPMLNAWWGLAFALNLLVLRQGRWTHTTRWTEFALGFLSGGILLVIVLGPRAFNYDWIAKGFLKGVLVIIAIESGVRLYRLRVRRAAEIPPSAQPAPSAGTARHD